MFPLSIPPISLAHYFGWISLKTYLLMLLLCLQTFSDFLLPVGIKFKLLFVACRALKTLPFACLTASLLTLFSSQVEMNVAVFPFYAYVLDIPHSWDHLFSPISHDITSACLLRKRLSRTVSAFPQTQLSVPFPPAPRTSNTPLLEKWSQHVY